MVGYQFQLDVANYLYDRLRRIEKKPHLHQAIYVVSSSPQISMTLSERFHETLAKNSLESESSTGLPGIKVNRSPVDPWEIHFVQEIPRGIAAPHFILLIKPSVMTTEQARVYCSLILEGCDLSVSPVFMDPFRPVDFYINALSPSVQQNIALNYGESKFDTK